mmetsp:Transcript_26038/g.90649  ORF Transcript_26038/g.90649 Transcript_26038/m.90649 type:complete len:132 (-) Transcript_26038:80-475(-)
MPSLRAIVPIALGTAVGIAYAAKSGMLPPVGDGASLGDAVQRRVRSAMPVMREPIAPPRSGDVADAKLASDLVSTLRRGWNRGVVGARDAVVGTVDVVPTRSGTVDHNAQSLANPHSTEGGATGGAGGASS